MLAATRDGESQIISISRLVPDTVISRFIDYQGWLGLKQKVARPIDLNM